MRVEDFTLQHGNDGNKFLTSAEGPTKTRQGGLETRLVTPKTFVTGNEEKRCPVMLFKWYLEKCPSEIKKTPMVKNTRNTIMKNMKDKTVVKKLKSFGIPTPRICPRASNKTISRAIDNTGPVLSRHAFSQLYPANYTASLCAPSHVYNFSHCSTTLNIAGNGAVQKSTSDIKQLSIQVYLHRRIRFWVISKRFGCLINFIWKSTTFQLISSKLKIC